MTRLVLKQLTLHMKQMPIQPHVMVNVLSQDHYVKVLDMMQLPLLTRNVQSGQQNQKEMVPKEHALLVTVLILLILNTYSSFFHLQIRIKMEKLFILKLSTLS